MVKKTNIISMDSYRKKTKTPKKSASKRTKKASEPVSPVVDMTMRRESIKAHERRLIRRTVLTQFIGAFAVVPTKGLLQAVSIFDVSEGGMAFDMPTEAGAFNEGESVLLRVYLSHDTYFPFQVTVSNVRPAEGGVMRHGALLDVNDSSYPTLLYFMKFLEEVSAITRKDNGDRVMGRVD